MEVLDDLLNRKSYLAIKHILNEDLYDLQCIDVVRFLMRKHAIIGYDTGTGKTYLACALIRLLLNEKPGRKILVFVKNKQLAQTPDDFYRLLGIRPVVSSGTQKDLKKNFTSKMISENSIFMLTHSALDSMLFLDIISEYQALFDTVIIDEAHNINNSDGSDTGATMKCLCRSKEYVFAMTATPIVTSVYQIAKLCCIVDQESYKNVKKVERSIQSGQFFDYDPLFYIHRDRSDFGIEEHISGDVIYVEPMEHQINVQPTYINSVCKGPGAINQAQALVDFILERKGQKGLVYVYEHATRGWLLPFLDNAGIRYGCVNGLTSPSEVKEVMRKFNDEGSLDVVIFSTTEALNLNCDWVMFYEFTVNVKQAFGRAYRGFESKVLKVYWMITKNSGEEEKFVTNIYNRSLDIQRVLGIKYGAVFDAAQKVDYVR